MSDLHGDFFVIAEQHRGLVLAVIDQGVMQATITRAGIERDVGKFILLDQIDDDVGLPALGRFLYTVVTLLRGLAHGHYLLNLLGRERNVPPVQS